VAALATVLKNRIHLQGMVGSPNDSRKLTDTLEGNVSDTMLIGERLAHNMLTAGGIEILSEVRAAQAHPLLGVRVLVTRAKERADLLANRLQELGAIPILAPMIAFAPPDDEAALNQAIDDLLNANYEWLALTSATTADVLASKLNERGATLPKSIQIACVGNTTARACEGLFGRAPNVVPLAFSAEGLASAMCVRGSRVLLLNADLAPPHLEHALQSKGAEVRRVIAYRTVSSALNELDVGSWLDQDSIDAVLFASGSAVTEFARRVSRSRLPLAPRITVVCMGASTTQVAIRHNISTHLTTCVASNEGLIESLIESYSA
jgi:uroporphyrinogen-III synthase